MTRFDPAGLQKAAKIPASLVRKARAGEVKKFSPATLDKFKKVYTAYWENRLDRERVHPEQWQKIIDTGLEQTRQIVKDAKREKKYDRALERGGVAPDERQKILDSGATERVIVEQIDKNRAAAEKIVENRRKRDSNLPGYNPSWHNVNDVLKQMARDTSRISSDWQWVAKYGSGKKKRTAAYREAIKKAHKRGRQYEH